MRGLRPPIVRRVVEPLADEPHARQRLRRSIVAPPQPAILAGETVIVLPNLGIPGARAILAAAYLDRAGPRRMISDAPIEPVATEIHQPPALTHPAIERIHHLQQLVFRMAAGHQHAIRPQQIQPLRVQVVIGDHIIRKPRPLQPIDDEQIDAVVPEPPGRTDVRGRPQPRRIADAAAVAMPIIGGKAEFRVFHQQDVDRIDHRQPALQRLGHHRTDTPDVVAVHSVGGARSEIDDVRRRASLGRPHEERNLELRPAGLQHRRISSRCADRSAR